MREIKFRAYNKKTKQIEEVKEIAFFKDDFVLNTRDMKTLKMQEQINSEEAVLLQFTGLLDKQGVEIYEGDIIPLGHSLSVVIWNDYIFDNPCFCLKVLNEDDLYEPFRNKGDIPNWIEIIGNIYEDSHLLDIN